MESRVGQQEIEDSTLVTIEGAVERIVYESPETGFFVGRLQEAGKTGLTTFVGNLMAVSPGETIRITGHWVDDKKFGRQVRVISYQTVVPSTIDGIEKYLASGLIRGIGPVYAKRLIDAFGVETLRVIDEEPEKLRKVEGIGRKRAEEIRNAWAEQKAIQSIMLFLQGHGIGVGQAVKIYKRYGDGAVAVLRENPYRLAEDISGIGFQGADAIAQKLGIDREAPQRLRGGIHFTLHRSMSDGHTFLPREVLLGESARLLEVSRELLPEHLERLVAEKKIVREDDAYYIPELYGNETGCDRYLKRLLTFSVEKIPIQIDKAIAWVQKTQEIELSAEQREAIRMACTEKVMVVTGGPGTGKTTLINCLIAIFEYKEQDVKLAAPTGRAAKRMEEATDHDAKTIHRLLEFSPNSQSFSCDENNPLVGDLFIIDECSMIDTPLTNALLRAIPPHARLFLVGDIDQLPSVGPGNVLTDIISSGVVPTVRLKTVFRQAAQSGIVANAHRINRGEEPVFNTEDFFMVERHDPKKAVETVVELVSSRIPNKFGLDAVKDIQVLAPVHRGEAGVSNLNEALQAALNPDGEPIGRKAFRVGDKVMQLRNNYELDVYNGDVGVIRMADETAQEAEVQFDDRVVLYPFEDLDNLGLAYAATIHKSQGSEYPAVVMPLLPQHYIMLQRNVLYTGVTRGKRLVVIVGSPKAVSRAVRTAEAVRRNTRLSDRLRNVRPGASEPRLDGSD